MILGYAPAGHDSISALLLGYYARDQLIYAGRVGTGWSAAARSLRALLDTLAAATTPICNHQAAAADKIARWITPRPV